MNITVPKYVFFRVDEFLAQDKNPKELNIIRYSMWFWKFPKDEIKPDEQAHYDSTNAHVKRIADALWEGP
jgi:hypothetical protein